MKGLDLALRKTPGTQQKTEPPCIVAPFVEHGRQSVAFCFNVAWARSAVASRFPSLPAAIGRNLRQGSM